IPNRFFQDWLSAHYLDLILESLRRETGSDALRVKWEVDENLQERVAESREPAHEEPKTPVISNMPRFPTQVRVAADLNPKYSFDNFVVGPSNQLAHAASIA